MNNPSLNNPNPAAQGMPIQCPNCRQQFSARIESMIDAGRDPAAKARFLSGQSNMAQCPHCGAQFGLGVPMVYHDHTKDLLITFIPPELNLPREQRQSIIGEMTRAIMNAVPQEERKAYMLNPIEPLTREGMMETILEKDGITREMMQAQRQKAQLVSEFLTATEDHLPALIQKHDASLDDEFFQIMMLQAEQAMGARQAQVAEQILERRDAILEQSSYGQEVIARAEQQQEIVQKVLMELQQMQQGGGMEIDDFIDYMLGYVDSDDHLQAVVGLARQVFDYQFFARVAQRAEETKDANKTQNLNTLRDRLLELTQAVDQQQQMAVQQIQAVIQQVLNAPNQDEVIEQLLPSIDDMFLSVLAASIQAAQQKQDLMAAARLKKLYEAIMNKMQQHAPPEARFINELMQIEDDLEARLLITEQAGDFGEPLLDYMDALIANISRRDDESAQMVTDQLRSYREAAASVIHGG